MLFELIAFRPVSLIFVWSSGITNWLDCLWLPLIAHVSCDFMVPYWFATRLKVFAESRLCRAAARWELFSINFDPFCCDFREVNEWKTRVSLCWCFRGPLARTGRKVPFASLCQCLKTSWNFPQYLAGVNRCCRYRRLCHLQTLLKSLNLSGVKAWFILKFNGRMFTDLKTT